MYGRAPYESSMSSDSAVDVVRVGDGGNSY